MIESATGIILRTLPLTETSLIVRWLTPNFGRISTVAKGACRPKSPFRGKLDLFYEAEFTIARSRRSELHTLREVCLRETHAALRRELGYLQQAAYCAKLIEQTTESESPLSAIYELMGGLLRGLPNQQPQPQTVFAFELKLLRDLGLEPDLEKSQITPGARRIATALLTSDWAGIQRLKPSARQVTELCQFLHGFLIFHLGKILPGRSSALGGGA